MKRKILSGLMFLMILFVSGCSCKPTVPRTLDFTVYQDARNRYANSSSRTEFTKVIKTIDGTNITTDTYQDILIFDDDFKVSEYSSKSISKTGNTTTIEFNRYFKNNTLYLHMHVPGSIEYKRKYSTTYENYYKVEGEPNNAKYASVNLIPFFADEEIENFTIEEYGNDRSALMKFNAACPLYAGCDNLIQYEVIVDSNNNFSSIKFAYTVDEITYETSITIVKRGAQVIVDNFPSDLNDYPLF